MNDMQNVKFDLSKIQISLVYDGNKKDSTTCNPDGSYMLSIDETNKRPFKLIPEGPTAATFDPPYRIIDPSQNISLCKSDIIFVFLGFTVKGQVRSKFANTGPKGLHVELQLADKGTALKTAVTEKDGYYKFDNVYPGKYVIKASKANEYSIDPKARMHDCEVSWESTETCSKSHILVTGYSIIGSFDKSLKGMILGIYSKSKDAPKILEESDRKDLPKVEGYYLVARKTITSADTFEVNDIPYGDYRVIPYFFQNTKHFVIEPNYVDVKVDHSNVTLASPFHVNIGHFTCYVVDN
jgi:hypothetical protein